MREVGITRRDLCDGGWNCLGGKENCLALGDDELLAPVMNRVPTSLGPCLASDTRRNLGREPSIPDRPVTSGEVGEARSAVVDSRSMKRDIRTSEPRALRYYTTTGDSNGHTALL